jgi:Protein of unknown function (DUF2854)
MLRQIPLGLIGLSVGGVLTLLGFFAYFVIDNATLNLVGFFYGIPILLGGLALKAAELEPAPYTQPTPANVMELRDRQATPTQAQIRNDVTRYRYGQRAHLDTSLEALGLAPTDEECPQLLGIREVETDGAYTLTLIFESTFFPVEVWQEKQEKLTTFFGPNIRVAIQDLGDEKVELSLISTMATA